MRLIFSLAILLFSAFAHAQAPVNDDCAGLIDLGILPYCSNPAQYTNLNATASDIDAVNNVPICFNGNPERDVWFQFTPPADGSIVDIVVSVYGNVDGNGTLRMPQVALYRGDCEFGGLAELNCAAAPLNVNQVQLQQFGLTPNVPYFLRINDYSATAAPNWGTFKLCVEKYVPEINMGDEASTQSCTGTLWDSGGPNGDYAPNENLTFTICPQDFHQCIVLNVESYDVEPGWDFLRFYIGPDATGTQLTQLTGFGQSLEVQMPPGCATIQFSSDVSFQGPGFKITWACSPEACTTPPVTTCDDPVTIGALPYAGDNLSNCFSGNSIADGPCDDDFLTGNDYVFAYTSPGDECIQIAVNGTSQGAGVGVYSECPSDPNATCIASAGGGATSVDPLINAAFLENPGTYYIVFGSGLDCSPFNISIDTVTCPVVLPPASTCDKALNIGGCSNTVPEIIALTPGAGDPNFIQDGVNQGCFVNPQQNYSFFYFTAGADGKFGFVVEAADPDEASDIDINVWGPIDSVGAICDHVSNNQPVRSTWSGGADPTGLADVNPVTGLDVNDDFDCGSPATPSAGGDDFVRRLDVEEGKIYVILLDDFGNAIVNGGISISFEGTTDGVLDAGDAEISVTADTAICAGQPVQLSATGGVAYGWGPDLNLSCTNCPNPVATPTQTSSYQVQIVGTCNTATRVVDIKIIEIELGPDITVCNNADFELNPNPYPDAAYSWTGGPGLSCYDCPTPTVSGLTTGFYTFIATLTTPQCVIVDSVNITVVNGQQPQYNIADNQLSCSGETVSIGGAPIAGSFYTWTSVPAGFSSSEPDPDVSPTQTTTYYLSVENGSCPVASVDSVMVTVLQPPVLLVQTDTAICNGQSVLLAATLPEDGVTYAWTPNNGTLSDASSATPLATPLQTTTYQLVASNAACTETRTVEVSVVNLNLGLSVPDTVLLCKGTPLNIQAAVTPAGPTVNWSPLQSLIIGPGGFSVTANPEESIAYTATVVAPGCVRKQTVFVQVDSIPADMSIHPSDTTVCAGSLVLLTSPLFDPGEYPNLEFEWTPENGQLTPDSLYNMVIQSTITTVYQRISRVGGCVDTAKATINVIPVASMQITPVDTVICPGQTVQLNLTFTPGVQNIEWMPSNTLNCTGCVSPIATPTGTTTYTASGDLMGCPVNASATVVVRQPPAFDFPADRTLCAGETIQLNGITVPGATYVWTSTHPGFGTVTQAQPIFAPTQNATYSVTANNGCSSSGQFSVSVITGSLSVSNDTTVCQGFPVLLTASGNLPGSFQWSNGQSGQAIQVTPAQTTTYFVTYFFGDNCELTDQITVNVQGNGADIVFPTDTELCAGESIQLNSAATPGATYSWTSVPAGFTSNLPTPTVTPAQSTTYQVTATLGNCVRTQSVNVIVYKATLTISNDTTICAGESVSLSATGSATGNYEWSNGEESAKITETPAQTTTYVVLYTFGNGQCFLEDSVKVAVVPNFSVSIVSDPDTNRINYGEPLELRAVVTPSQNLNGFMFTWFENDVQVGMGEKVTVTPSTNDTTPVYRVVAKSPAGCLQTASIGFTLVAPEVVFPNAFTPDGDGTNDVFRIIVLEGKASVDRMEIYSRWGQKVFESSDPQAAWNGEIDGQPAPSDVYIYMVWWRRGDGALQPLAKGEITLLR